MARVRPVGHIPTRRDLWLAMAIITAVVCALAGCDFGQPTSDTGRTSVSASHASATSVATRAGTCNAQSLPQGWSWYRDARYPFRMAVPPGWRTGAFEYIPDGSGSLSSPSHIHVVDLFAPESVGLATSSGKQRNDTGPLIAIEVDVGSGTTPPPFGSGSLTNWYKQTFSLCVGATPIMPYLFTNSEDDVEWAAVLPAGPKGFTYNFNVASHAATATRDGMFFQTALATFGPMPNG